VTTIDPRRTLGDRDDDRLVSVDEFVDTSQCGHLPRSVTGWLTTTDHKALGVAYIVTSLVFLAIGGVLAGIIRAELAEPGLQIVSEQTYNGVFTIHGSVMVYLFAVPFGFGLANYLVPLQIGAPDLAFPRLNAFSYWLYLIGGAVMLVGFLSDGGAAAFGWFAYPPLSGMSGSPGLGADLWIISIILTGTSGTLTAVNVITTVTMMRTPGMTLFRMPILTWNIFITAFMVLLAFPVLSGALVMLEADRQFGTNFFEPVRGGSPILWQHLFWFFGTPRCTSWRCRSSAWSPRSSRCSRVVRCSATRAWSWPPWRSARCRRRCGRTICSSPARSCCRSSRSRRS
jgi:cytochrome c oxidase subunit 1